jgi:DNA polymerase III subunit epsilon
MVTVFDTETTGKSNFGLPPSHQSQPHIVQLAAVMCDNNGEEINSMCLLIKPKGWAIPAEATKIHGITTEMCEASGVDIASALRVFDWLLLKSEYVVAHNIQFDRHMVCRDSVKRSEMIDLKGFCTMKAMTPICKLPGRYDDFKWPSLQEAYRHCFKTEFVGAHNAMADVRACSNIYFWLQAQKKQQAQVPIIEPEPEGVPA